MNTICLLLTDKIYQKQLKESLIGQYVIVDYNEDITEQSFDLFITDIQTLEQFDYQIRQLRQNISPVCIPVLLTISSEKDRFANQSLMEIVDDTVDKDIDISLLLMRIRALLRINNLSRELHEQKINVYENNVFKTILAHLPLDLLVVKYPDAQIIAMSNHLRNFIGNIEGQSAYNSTVDNSFHQPGKSTSDKKSLPIYRALEKNELVSNEEWILEKDGGKKRFLQINASPILGSSGKVEGAVIIGLDITRHNQIQNELKAERQLLETLIENIPVMIKLYDQQMNIVHVNQTFQILTGWSDVDAREKNLMELAYPDQEYRQMVARYMLSRPTGFTDFKMRTSNGKTLDSSWSFIRTADGRLVGIGIDITERKKNEEMLYRTHQKYRDLFNSIDEGYCIIKIIFDSHGHPFDFNFLEVNKSFTMQTGIKEPVGRCMREIEPSIEKEWIEIFGNVSLTGKPARFTKELKLLNRWFDVYAFSLGALENQQVAVVFNDVSGRIASEIALRESEDRFHTLADNISQLAWMATPQGEIFWFNKRWYEFTGTDYETMKKEGLKRIIHSDHLDHVLHSFQKALQSGSPWENTFLMLRSDGKYCWFLTRAMPIRDRSGTITRWFGTNTDISEIKQVQEELSISAQRFERIISSQIIGTCISDLKGNILYANDYFLNTIGYSRDDLDKHVITWQKITPPEYYSMDIESFEKMQRSGSIKPYEKEYIRQDNSRVWILLAATTLPGPQEQVLVFALDVTDRKKALIEAQNRRAEIEAILSSFPDGYIIYDNEGNILQMNNLAAKITGISTVGTALSGTEHLQKSLTLMTADGQPFPADMTPNNRALHGETIRNEIVCVKRPDREYWISVSASPISADGLNGAIMEFSDITKMYNLQKQLTEERNFVDAIFETAGALITVMSRDYHFIRFNRACEKLTGYSSAEVNGRSIFDLFILKEEVDLVKNIQQRLLNGETIIEYENHWVTRSGDKRFIRWQSSTLSDQSGNIVHIITTGTDITNRKMLQEQLSASYREMESFSYSISHDLRGPLGIIKGFVDILYEDYCGILGKEGCGYLKLVNDNVSKIQQLITSLLNLSRVGRQEIKREKLNLSRIIKEILQELIRQDSQRKVNIIIKPNVFAIADPHLIQLALENLLRNAWKFSSKKEITRIEFGYDMRNGKKIFFIKDNGAGFDMKFVEKIFQPFQRIHKEKEFSGTGIGLSIVLQVIKRHHGKLWAIGEKDKGATFYFTLD